MRKQLVEQLKVLLAVKEDEGLIYSLTDEERDELIEFLNINDCDNAMELRILRNYYVKTLADAFHIDSMDYKLYSKSMAIITSIIDKKILEMGGEL